MEHNIYIYIAVMAIVTYAIRVLPLTLIRKEIKNPFIRSFLYYVPYTTLAVMTFPAILQETQTPAAGALALGVGGAVFVTVAAVYFKLDGQLPDRPGLDRLGKAGVLS